MVKSADKKKKRYIERYDEANTSCNERLKHFPMTVF